MRQYDTDSLTDETERVAHQHLHCLGAHAIFQRFADSPTTPPIRLVERPDDRLERPEQSRFPSQLGRVSCHGVRRDLNPSPEYHD